MNKEIDTSMQQEIACRMVGYFTRYGPVSQLALDYLQKHTKIRHAKKYEIVIAAGAPNESVYFVAKGVLRGYIMNGQKEITTWINEEDEVAGTIRNFGTPLPSNEIVQALDDCILVELPNTVIEYLYDHFPETNRIGRLIMTENYQDAEERAFIARIPSAEERYRRLLQRRGSLVNRISLKYIASYLNMNLETLSRVRSRKQ